jgi:hypothetical protein
MSSMMLDDVIGLWLCMSDVMSCDDKGRHYYRQNDQKNWGKIGGFVTLLESETNHAGYTLR